MTSSRVFVKRERWLAINDGVSELIELCVVPYRFTRVTPRLLLPFHQGCAAIMHLTKYSCTTFPGFGKMFPFSKVVLNAEIHFSRVAYQLMIQLTALGWCLEADKVVTKMIWDETFLESTDGLLCTSMPLNRFNPVILHGWEHRYAASRIMLVTKSSSRRREITMTHDVWNFGIGVLLNGPRQIHLGACKNQLTVVGRLFGLPCQFPYWWSTNYSVQDIQLCTNHLVLPAWPPKPLGGCGSA